MSAVTPTKIWIALRTRLETLVLSPVHTIAFPREDFTPPTDSANRPQGYLSVRWFPNTPVAATLGDTGVTRHRGIFQVSVHARRGQDSSVAIQNAGLVAAHFPLDMALAYDGQTVRSEVPAEVGPDVSEDDSSLAEIPVTIRYWSDETRS